MVLLGLRMQVPHTQSILNIALKLDFEISKLTV